MTVNDMSWFCVEVDLKRPVQARREAQDGPGVSGCVCLSAASSASRRLIRASQGTRRASMSGVFDILSVCFFRQVKKSDSPIKSEKLIGIQAHTKEEKKLN